MKIQVSDILSKWVGDSEINLKRIFTDYKRLYEKSKEAPILFLNECDQIIGKRIDTQSSVDQMNNGLQNIVLEEMETFPGILIGTTNLVTNMDPAFERRWTVKLTFEPPNETAMIMIWKNAIKGITTEEAKTLSIAFKFTPGEIMNISRRYTFEKLLGTKKKRIDILTELCKTEKYQLHRSGAMIGFEFTKALEKTEIMLQ
jgi:SpoVK/Ycf46/Vps4 family AAA+-type ATPase